MNTRHITSRGFTIIETLVAIAILMISITGPLVIAQKALFAAYYARDQVVASFLAQDAIEFIKNKRDNNILTSGGNWYDGFTGPCFSNGASVCRIDTRVASGDIHTCVAGNGTCALYHDATGFGTSNGGGQLQSYFSRSFYFTHDTTSGSSDCQTSHDKCTLTVRVWWNTGTVSNEVVIKNELFNVGR